METIRFAEMDEREVAEALWRGDLSWGQSLICRVYGGYRDSEMYDSVLAVPVGVEVRYGGKVYSADGLLMCWDTDSDTESAFELAIPLQVWADGRGIYDEAEMDEAAKQMCEAMLCSRLEYQDWESSVWLEFGWEDDKRVLIVPTRVYGSCLDEYYSIVGVDFVVPEWATTRFWDLWRSHTAGTQTHGHTITV